MQQPFANLDQLVRTLRVILPRPREDWRLVKDPLVGQINGLPHFVGGTVATNGIMVLLLNSSNTFCLGHLGWFVADASETNVALSDLWENNVVSAKPAKQKQLVKQLADYYTW